MFPLEPTGGIATIPVESEDGGFLEAFRYVRSTHAPLVMRERIILTVKGPRGGNRYILWLTQQEAESLRDTLSRILVEEVQDAPMDIPL